MKLRFSLVLCLLTLPLLSVAQSNLINGPWVSQIGPDEYFLCFRRFFRNFAA